MANSKITVESLNLHYGENHALKKVNMETMPLPHLSVPVAAANPLSCAA